MKQNIFLLFMLLFLISNLTLVAKCYSFRKVDSLKVCIDGDSNADRRKAMEICKSITGSDCGGIGGYTGSCIKSGNLKCYNADSKEQKNIDVD